MHRILVVDNEPDELRNLRRAVSSGPNREVLEASSAAAAILMLNQQDFDVIVTDLNMDGDDAGIRVLEAARQRDPLTQVIVVTAWGTPQTNARAMELGAYEFLDRLAPGIDVNFMLTWKVGMAIEHRQEKIWRSLGAGPESNDASGLFVNVWFPDYSSVKPTIPVNEAVTLRVNIGPALTKCLTPDYPDLSAVKERHLLFTLPHVDVLLTCVGAKVDIARKRLFLPPGPGAYVDYSFVAINDGPCHISIAILVSNEAIHRVDYTVDARSFAVLGLPEDYSRPLNQL